MIEVLQKTKFSFLRRSLNLLSSQKFTVGLPKIQ